MSTFMKPYQSSFGMQMPSASGGLPSVIANLPGAESIPIQSLNSLVASVPGTDTSGLRLPSGGAAGSGFGFNLGTAGLALDGLKTLGSLFASFKTLSLANKQFQFQKAFTEKNMANQVSTYNTALADRARSRAAVEGQSAAQSQAYIDQNRLKGM